MKRVTQTSSRKDDHIRVNLVNSVESGLTNGLEDYSFLHEALPEVNLKDVDTSVKIFKKHLNAPLLISSMTGGTELSKNINRNLAISAEECKIAMGVGSQRAALENAKLKSTFNIREYAPKTLIFANIGAIQLNYGISIDDCQRIIDMVEADGIILHLNPLQEAIQEGGNTNFCGLGRIIESVCRNIKIPVIAKEVGWGISERTAKLLVDCGVDAIDVAGAGGTSWSQVEMHVTHDQERKNLAAMFKNWGITTANSILNIRNISPTMMIIASGGLRNGLDMTKCFSLGAKLAGAAGIFLSPATKGPEQVVQVINQLIKQIRTTMFITGSQKISDLEGLLVKNLNISND
ncbi:type 2 isopentenyl-diphosphate Delta-isomerase [Chloroflexota bacterium]